MALYLMAFLKSFSSYSVQHRVAYVCSVWLNDELKVRIYMSLRSCNSPLGRKQVAYASVPIKDTHKKCMDFIDLLVPGVVMLPPDGN